VRRTSRRADGREAPPRRLPGAVAVEHLRAGDAADPPAELLEFAHTGLARTPLAVRAPGAGQAQAYNCAVRRATGRLVHFVEPSLEFGFEVLESAAQLLRDPAVGACGPFGLDTSDWRDFQPAEGPAVMALEYLVSIRRDELGRVVFGPE